jgi:alpha-beta hydrolase superfamily lysophospholipase
MTNHPQSIEHSKEIDMKTSKTKSTQFIARPEGRIAYEVAGEGPLVVLLPGMGDLRAGYRFLAPALEEAGYRVATTDLRGQGEFKVAEPAR